VAENALRVEVRDAVGKGAARKLRAAGRIPAVCYGKAKSTVELALDPHALRKLLDRHTFRLSDSDLELLFRPIADAAGLAPPQTKAWVNGFEVDFFWPDLGLVVETDGQRYHRTASSQTRDRVRDQVHTAAGLTTLRFTHWQVKHERSHVRTVLERTARHLRNAAVDLSRAPSREKSSATKASRQHHT